ncbi:MAG: hypothetical protein ACKOE3_01675 [Betaproteobacteria bacterium]
MADSPNSEEAAQWQRRLASQANNRAWTLAEKATRTAAEDEELLSAAHAAIFFWNLVGNAKQRAHAALLLAHAKASAGLGASAAQLYAQAASKLQSEGCAAWELALMAAVGANVAAASGDAAGHQERYTAAHALTQALADADDRAILEATLAVLPEPL